jgi:hypothetical protein
MRHIIGLRLMLSRLLRDLRLGILLKPALIRFQFIIRQGGRGGASIFLEVVEHEFCFWVRSRGLMSFMVWGRLVVR